LSRQMKKDQR